MESRKLVINSNKDCQSNVDYITEIKQRLDYIESVLKIEVKKTKTKPSINGNEVQK